MIRRILVGIVLGLLWMGPSWASTVNFVWLPNEEADVAGHKLYRAKMECASATEFKPVHTFLSNSGSDVIGKGTYCYYLTVFDIAGNESVPSGPVEVTITQEQGPSGLMIQSIVQ